MKAVQQRVGFANLILTMIDTDGFDVGCIWFTDEAHFHLNGIVNKQISEDFVVPKILISANPHYIRLKLLIELRYAPYALSGPFSCEKR